VTELNAYRRPRKTQPGCQHMLGCKCEAPFWLRQPSAAEEAFAARYFGPLSPVPTGPREHMAVGRAETRTGSQPKA
jgi:hypothetical protein